MYLLAVQQNAACPTGPEMWQQIFRTTEVPQGRGQQKYRYPQGSNSKQYRNMCEIVQLPYIRGNIKNSVFTNFVPIWYIGLGSDWRWHAQRICFCDISRIFDLFGVLV